MGPELPRRATSTSGAGDSGVSAGEPGAPSIDRTLDSPAEREAVVAPVAPTDSDEVRIRIVRDLDDGHGEQPVPGADVWWLSDRELRAVGDEASDRVEDASAHLGSMVQRIGRQTESDVRGEVEVAFDAQALWVFAVIDGWSGFRRVGWFSLAVR